MNNSLDRSLHFSTNVPIFFEKLTSGQTTIPITYNNIDIVVVDHNRPSKDLTEFAATLVRGSLAVDLLRVDILNDTTRDTAPLDRYLERRKVEEINLAKLHDEYKKLTSVNG